MAVPLISAFLMFALPGCGENDAPAAPVIPARTDAQIVKDLHDRMQEIESASEGDQQQVHDIAAVMRKDRTQDERTMHAAMMSQMMGVNFKLLEASATIQVPPISNPVVARYAAAMVDDHKQWAILQQARIGAVKALNEKALDSLSEQADRMATQEALHMMMAYKTVGLDPE